MPTLHLMVGLPCSGKTTLAKQLETDRRALRLSPDEWIAHLLGVEAPEEQLDAARDPFEQVLWEVAARSLALGIDVILDFGFWGRGEREDYRRRAAALGADSELHFCDVTTDVLLERLEERNECLPPGCFRVDPARVQEWLTWFQPPTEDELAPRPARGPALRTLAG